MRPLPAQQDEFGAEAGAHRHQQPGGAGQRAGAASRVSRRTCRTEADDRLPTSASERQVSSRARAGSPSGVADRLQHLRAARVADPGGHVLGLEVVVGQEGARPRRRGGGGPGPAGRRPARSGSPGRRRPSRACARCPGRGGCGCRPPRAPARPAVARMVGADRDDRGGAVAEQRAGHQVRRGGVVALHGQRAQFDRQQHRDLVRAAAAGSRAAGRSRRRRPRSRARTAAPASRPAAAPAARPAGPPARAPRCRSPRWTRPGRRPRARSPAASSAPATACSPNSQGDVDEGVVGLRRSRSDAAYRSSGSARWRPRTAAAACSRSSTPPLPAGRQAHTRRTRR